MRYFAAKQDLFTACGFEYREAEEKWVHKDEPVVMLPIERFTKWSRGSSYTLAPGHRIISPMSPSHEENPGSEKSADSTYKRDSQGRVLERVAIVFTKPASRMRP